MRNLLGERGKILNDVFVFLRKTFSYNASLRTFADKEKFQYTLLRRTHIIEKGLSFRNPKQGFGQAKVEALIDDLELHLSKYGDSEFFTYPISAISTYVDFIKKEGIDISSIVCKLESLKTRTNFQKKKKEPSGIKLVTKENILSATKDFKDILFNRHSIRFFSNKKVPIKKLDEALFLAQRTPSACNRQGWKTHVFMEDDAVNLVKWQGGSRGFEDEIRCAILVTANMKAFLSHEIHQAYIDGGLYAMNLINSLTYVGLGTIPLSCGFHETRLSELKNFEIPKNEVPIIIIGIGEMEETFKVAVSKRKTVEETNTYHKL